MHILRIYKKYFIPLNLQKHMLKTAGVGKIICDSSNLKLNKTVIVTTLLLHDMGNILKFDVENTGFFDRIELGKIESYKNTKDKYRQKYGPNADKATLAILKELGIDYKIIELCAKSHGSHLSNINNFVDKPFWDRKIVYYSDMRAGPFGILGVNQRFDDLVKRYPKHKDTLLGDRKKCLTIEKQLQKHSRINLTKIDEDKVNMAIKELEKGMETTFPDYASRA